MTIIFFIISLLFLLLRYTVVVVAVLIAAAATLFLFCLFCVADQHVSLLLKIVVGVRGIIRVGGWLLLLEKLRRHG